jgi:DNA-binding beta-propeller fold protein YncE
MGAALLTRRSISCQKSYGVCVAVPHGLLIVPDYIGNLLLMYSLIDGTLIRSIGSPGNGKGQFRFHNGGLCVSPDGDSVLVADYYNHRVQEVRILDGSWVRFVGIGVLYEPQFVDCNADTIVLSESGYPCISVLSWVDGSVRARFGSYGSGPGELSYPRGVRLSVDGSGLVVADRNNNRLCVFRLSGEFVKAVGSRAQGLEPYNVLECALDGSFIVANWGRSVVKLSQDGVKFEVYSQRGSDDGEFLHRFVLAAAALPNYGYLAMDVGNQRVQHLAHLRARLAWMRACTCRVI